ncbi:MAG: PAS domain S-box protein [Bacteroidia bacterium]|nr:PAS domain S-box protein [Bacteroidia bacterium]MDW8347708.1 PAS domain S-box protein [Bacteroidia bacterium]
MLNNHIDYMGLIDVLLGKSTSVDKQEYENLKIELGGQMRALHEGAIVSETDIKGNITFVNDKFCQVSGYSKEELLGKNHRILKSGLQPDSLFQELWSTISSGRVWKGLICNKKKNGEYYWVDSTIVPVLNEKGVPIKYVGVRFEVTDLILAKQDLETQLNEIHAQQEEIQQINEELNANNEQLEKIQLELKHQFDALNEAAIVSITDVKGNITYVNDTFCKISKYSREELIGKNHRILKSGKQPDSIFKEMWETISNGKTWQGIICNKAKDGSFYWVHSTIKPILNSKGLPEKYISIRFDITAEKELQDIIQGKETQISELNSTLVLAQKALEKKLEDSERELKQSLNYAMRIQKAIIPTLEEVQNDIGDKYEVGVLFQPCEMVSGDFYWSASTHNRTVLFIGDATGHGVAGSYMTLIAINALERLVKDKMIILPDILLEELDKEIRRVLKQDKQDDRSVNDSLEGYAVLIEGNKISVASSMRPIVVVTADEVKEIPGSKKSIGGKDFLGDSNFQVHNLELKSGDTLYLYSDGYETQLGGPDGHKKFGKAEFIKMLKEIHVFNTTKKRMEALQRRWKDWKGFFVEQTDDIVVVSLTAK